MQYQRDRLRRASLPGFCYAKLPPIALKSHFGELVSKGEVERFELPNLGALNFLLHQSLGGGGTVSLRTDAQGKTFGAALLGMEIDLPDEL